MADPAYPKRHPYWLRETKRLFPHPLFAGCISVACLLLGILFAGVAINVPVWPMGIASVLFFAGAYATASSAVTRDSNEEFARQQDASNAQKSKPTFPVLVLLIGVYSWLLTLAMHVFGAFFKNGPGSIKYFVTVGIAIASTLFMQLYGKRIIRQHFGARGGRDLELSTRQALYVAIFVISCGIYFAWVVS